MGYANVFEVDEFLAQALTSARPDATNQKKKLINIGDVRNLNRIPDELVGFYISTADTTVDGILSQQYHTPLKKCASGQWKLDADISEYNQMVEITDATSLQVGDEIIIRNDNTGTEELHIVNTLVDQNTVTVVDPILTNFSGDQIRVTRLKFPPPVNVISARLAASYLYDKYFSAQVSPNLSEYGQELRRLAHGGLNDILNGKAILRCQRRIGDQFGNPWLDDTYQHRDRRYAVSDRDMSTPK